MLKTVGVKVEYGESLHEGEYRGTFRTVSDREHAEMIRLYVEDGLSLERIAEHLSRSSRTPLLHLQKHNRNIIELLVGVVVARPAEELEAYLKVRQLRKGLVRILLS